MVFYWFMFALPLLWGLLQFEDKAVSRLILGVFGLFLIFVIGFRDEVGCDFGGYIRHFFIIQRSTWEHAFSEFDSAHVVVNRALSDIGLDYYAVNVVQATIFSTGLCIFIGRQPLPWLAMLVSTPYLVTVVGMGYERQASALGLIMLAILAYADRKVWLYLSFVVLAGLFHRTAFILLPFAILINGFRFNFWVIATLVAGFGVAGSTLFGQADHFVDVYVNHKDYESAGALVRMLVTLAAVTVFLIFRKDFKQKYKDYDFLFYCAIAAVVAAPLVSAASTAVDRLLLYLLPFQVAVVSRLPDVFSESHWRAPIIVGIILSYAVLYGVWLNFSPEAQDCWMPYLNIIFE